jgi:hypothetical protein
MGPPNAVDDDAEQDDDHADEPDQVGGDLRVGMLVDMTGMTGMTDDTEVDDHVRDAAEDEDQQAEPDDDREAEDLVPQPFYR